MKELYQLYAKSNGETIRQHTDKLLNTFEEFIQRYGHHFNALILSAIKYACEYHDYGKALYLFQKSVKNDKFLILGNHMVIGNFGGYPSITIPSGFVDNMPVGINITGRAREDDVVLNIANKLEGSMEYANQIAKEMK